MKLHILFAFTFTLFTFGCIVPDRPNVNSSTLRSDRPGPTSTATVEIPIRTMATPNSQPSPTMHALDPCSEDLGAELAQLELAYQLGWEPETEIFTIYADGSNPFQLTDNEVRDIVPKWSPNGKYIAYITTESEENQHFRIQLINDQGEIQNVNTGEYQSYPDFSWSPDGTRIAFTDRVGGDIDVFLLDIVQNEVTNLTKGQASQTLDPIWSSNGSTLAFISLEVAATNLEYRINILNTESKSNGIEEVLTDVPGDVLAMAWHPSKDLLMIAVNELGVWGEIYQIDPETGETEQITDDGTSKLDPKWSPDGSMISYLSLLPDEDTGDGFDPNQLRIRNAEGESAEQVFEIPEAVSEISDYEWAPDSRHLAFNATAIEGDARSTDLYVLNVCTGQLTTLVEDARLASFSWRPTINH